LPTVRTCVRITSQGHPLARLRRALAAGNPLLVRAAAAELTHIELDDALAICLVLLDREPERYEPAAVRFLGRLLLERRGLTLADAERAAGWLTGLGGGEGSKRAALGLAELCDDVALSRAAECLHERLEGTQRRSRP
jgi:hypothetical protein